MKRKIFSIINKTNGILEDLTPENLLLIEDLNSGGGGVNSDWNATSGLPQILNKPTTTVIAYQATLPTGQPIGSKAIETLDGTINGIVWRIHEFTSLGWVVIKQPSYTNYNFPRTLRIEAFTPNAFVAFTQASGSATQKTVNTGFINVSDIVCNEGAAGFLQASKRKRLHAFDITMNTSIDVQVVIFKTNSDGANQTEIFNQSFNGATFQVNLPTLQEANFPNIVIERGDKLYAYEKVSGVTSGRWSYRYNLEFLNL